MPLQIQPIRKQDTIRSWSRPIATTTRHDEYFCLEVMSSVLAQQRTEKPEIMVPINNKSNITADHFIHVLLAYVMQFDWPHLTMWLRLIVLIVCVICFILGVVKGRGGSSNRGMEHVSKSDIGKRVNFQNFKSWVVGMSASQFSCEQKSPKSSIGTENDTNCFNYKLKVAHIEKKYLERDNSWGIMLRISYEYDYKEKAPPL